MTVSAAVARAWDAALGAHHAWKAALARRPAGDAATALTRDRWLLPLLYELGYGRPETLTGGIDLPPGLGETQPTHFPLSHRITWSAGAGEPTTVVPLHLVGGGISIDNSTPGVTARAPQSMVQDYLNRSRSNLWGIVSNGHTLRLLRDASTLTKQSYVEFDLDDIFDNQRYADFRLFLLTVHASRVAPIADDKESDSPTLAPESCWLEQWRTAAIADGTRALTKLREGVATALTHLGTGFVAHPWNSHLRSMLATSPDAAKDLHRALLRIAYRFIVLFVAEDRDLLHNASTDTDAQNLYNEYFSTTRLRHLATTRTGTRHTDLWAAHQIVTDALAGDGLDELALPGLGATLFTRENLGILANAVLPNRDLLAAIRALAEITDIKTGAARPVDYRNLDSEELGGIYEGLLAYTPRYDAAARTFSLEIAAGNDRKKSGSYYTPSGLIALVLDEALDPLITEALDTADPEAALLAITVVDPAVGSGHFVVAAARRIATALATVRTGDTEPSPRVLRAATADVIERCLYGVDLNDLAIEITKVALWLEAFDGSRPFPFLDAHFKVGNSLLGTTPALIRKGVPDAAFAVLTGDDPAWTAKLKARNKAERARESGQVTAFDVETAALTKQARQLEEMPATTLATIRARADSWRRLEDDPDLATKKFAADAWCTAFLQLKSRSTGQSITHDTVRQIIEDPTSVPASLRKTVGDLARQYRVFHWHLEFPGIFTAPETGSKSVEPVTGWQGGFSCVIGNPTWDRVKIQDKEFFSAIGRKDIADAKTAAIRTSMIKVLAIQDPPLYDAYLSALRMSDGVSHLLLHSGRYPLTGQGDVNSYSVFAETMRTITAPTGIAGMLTPTGLATDKTTAPFFADTLDEKRLLTFYDFENEDRVFSGTDHRMRFAITAISGINRAVAQTRFAFLTRHLADVPDRRFELAPDEVLALNPNTGTLPMFRTRTDADITLGIYRRHPVLIRDGNADGNPWGLSFCRLFDMANDSGLFHQPTDLTAATFNGWSYERQEYEYLPLYEAKMLGHFDHRFSTYRDATQAQLNVGSLPRLTAEQHDDPQTEALARYWVAQPKVAAALDAKWDRKWLLGWRDIARASDMRTFVPSVLPSSAVAHVFPLAFPKDPKHGMLLHAIWSSIAVDYIVRQKISGTHMIYSVVKQLACPTPTVFAQPTSWQAERTLAEWVTPYVLELSYTSWRLQPYANEIDDDSPPFHWDPDRRALLRADLDAAMLHVYGLTRAESEHILDSFPVVRKYEQRDFSEYRTRRLVLEAFDRMTDATARGGHGWIPLATPPAGEGPRHPATPHPTVPQPRSSATPTVRAAKRHPAPEETR
ncbi:Possible restriction /modification enzyme [Amycolatopsis camponoti]|uniref:site-specific DNA-methyltransferase (adenine-specific) n=1 Tax=Amycolatopsis camponoti TaxID=2606593 RepID=A0A6I8LS72_9PSEU|nr:DNA methyltransferase [Amycolatopsis camponoti]VVJ19633.1 Possible restriction /modification enzyme [Amycolatopsis camponoti]